MKDTYRLIALDLDGTLLNSDGRISPRSAAAVKEILRRGKQAVFATGRCMGEIEAYLNMFPEMNFLICESGACIYDLKERKHLFLRPIAPPLAEEIIRAAEKEEHMAAFFMGNRAFMDSHTAKNPADFGLGDPVTGTVQVENLFAFYRENPMEVEKINLFFRGETPGRRVLRRLAGKPLSISGSLSGNLEINAAGVNKGAGLRMLCDRLDIPLSQVIAVGDNRNDGEMLRAAGLPVAMGNAVPALVPFARVKTLDCNHDGAALVMEEYMLS